MGLAEGSRAPYIPVTSSEPSSEPGCCLNREESWITPQRPEAQVGSDHAVYLLDTDHSVLEAQVSPGHLPMSGTSEPHFTSVVGMEILRPQSPPPPAPLGSVRSLGQHLSVAHHLPTTSQALAATGPNWK